MEFIGQNRFCKFRSLHIETRYFSGTLAGFPGADPLVRNAARPASYLLKDAFVMSDATMLYISPSLRGGRCLTLKKSYYSSTSTHG